MNKFTFIVTDTEGSNGEIEVNITESSITPAILQLMKSFPFPRYIYSNGKVEYGIIANRKVESINDDIIVKIMDQLITTGKV